MMSPKRSHCVPVNRTKLLIYTLGGALTGIAGVLHFSYLSIGDPTTAVGMELDIIAAVVIGGASLLHGVENFIGDLTRNGGLPAQVDTRKFSVGKNLATTPGAVVYRTPVMELIQYQPARPDVATPVRGLYLAGDWIDTGLPATIESAVRSGHRAADRAASERLIH